MIQYFGKLKLTKGDIDSHENAEENRRVSVVKCAGWWSACGLQWWAGEG